MEQRQMCVCMFTDESTHQMSGFATAAQFEAAFGQASNFGVEPATSEGIFWQFGGWSFYYTNEFTFASAMPLCKLGFFLMLQFLPHDADAI